MSKTDRAIMIGQLISPSIRAIDVTIFYAYNTKSCLWQKYCDVDFKNYIMELFNQASKDIKKNVKTFDDCDSDKEFMKSVNDIHKLHDNEGHQRDIHKRIWSFMLDSNFVTKLDSMAHIFSLKDGMKIDLRTLEVSKRIEKDYLTYESTVSFTDKTPHANKFFKQIMKNEEEREYMRKILGYSMTAETCARSF